MWLLRTKQTNEQKIYLMLKKKKKKVFFLILVTEYLFSLLYSWAAVTERATLTCCVGLLRPD